MIDGNWNVTVKTPMGAQPSVLTLKTAGGALTGSQSAQGQTIQLKNGKAEGNNASWAMDITTPMPMTLEANVTVDGNKMTGKVKAGAFGSFDLEGTRA